MEQTKPKEIVLFPKQTNFIEAEQRFTGYGGGFGNGKTMSGCIKAYEHCQQPDAFFLIGRRHATDLRDSTLRDFLQLFGHLGHYSPGTSSFKFFHTKSEIIFRHLDDMQSLTNMNLSGFWIDQAEEVDEAAFDFLIGRMRRATVQKRQAFITFNMAGHDWIWRRFKKGIEISGKPLQNPEDYALIEATTLENKENLPEDYVKSLLAQPDDYVKRYVYGSWDVFAGQIFSEFSLPIHVVKPFRLPVEWERIRAIDHGQKHPTCCLWGAIDYEGDIWLYREYYQPDTPVSTHVKNINTLSEGEKYSYTVLSPDAFAQTKEKKTEYGTVILYSTADEYLDAGIGCIRAQNDVLAGINRVREYLKINDQRLHKQRIIDDQPVNGAPRIYIFENCINLIEEMGQYKWRPQKFGQEDRVKEAPVKSYDDAVDALRYLIMSRPQVPNAFESLPAHIYGNPLELARRAQQLNKTIDELLVMRAKNTHVTHSSGGVTHRGGVSHNDRRDPFL